MVHVPFPAYFAHCIAVVSIIHMSGSVRCYVSVRVCVYVSVLFHVYICCEGDFHSVKAQFTILSGLPLFTSAQQKHNVSMIHGIKSDALGH